MIQFKGYVVLVVMLWKAYLNPIYYSLASQICEALVLITNYRKIGGHRLPGWHLTAEDPINRGKLVDAKGTFNLGLSHGVTGILALLSIASLKGLVVDGQKDAIRSSLHGFRKKRFPKRIVTIGLMQSHFMRR